MRDYWMPRSIENSLLNTVRRILLIVAVSIMMLATAHGQNATWLGTISSQWNEPQNWLPASVPASGNVFITGGGPTCLIGPIDGAVFGDGTITIGPADGLGVESRASFTLGNVTVQNDGATGVDNLNPSFNSAWVLNGDLSLNGSGQFYVLGIRSYITGNGHLINASTIQGSANDALSGLDRVEFTNLPTGLVEARGGGLKITPNSLTGVTNQGTIRALNAGTLILGTGEYNNSMGTIEAAMSGVVRFENNLVITGGTLRSSGTGLMEVPNNQTATLIDVAIQGTLQQRNNTDLFLEGTIVNDGIINESNAGNLTDIVVDTFTTLEGGGRITLGGTTNGRILDQAGADGVLTNVGNTIEGIGQIGVNSLRLINEASGIIDANDSSNSGTLTLDPPDAVIAVNRGVFRASNGGNLVLSAGEFDNSFGTIEALAGSKVTLTSSAVVTGGAVSTSADGSIEVAVSQTATLIDVTNLGEIQQKNNSDLFLDGTIDNQGVITAVNAGNFTDIVVDSVTMLEGGGVVTLGGTTNGRILDQAGADGVLTNVDNTIQGIGQIGANSMRLVNEVSGIVDANDTASGGTLTLDPPTALTMVNSGVFRASNGGNLVLTAGEFDNDFGTIEALAGSKVILSNSAVVSGGTLDTSDDGTIEIPNSQAATLIDISNLGVIEQQNNSSLFLDGTINNQGVINEVNAGNFTDMIVDTATTLEGGGIIKLGGTVNGRIRDQDGVNGVLTNVDNTIQGIGQIGVNSMQLINEASGIIEANDTANSGTLTIDPPDASMMINRGIFRASNGGNLVLSAGGFDNDQGSIEALTGSKVTLSNSATITGGTLSSSGNGFFEVAASQTATLVDVANLGKLDQNNNTDLFLEGTIDNQGSINVVSTGNFTDLTVNSPVMLTGAGLVSLNQVNSRIFGTGDIEVLEGRLRGIGQVNVPSVFNGATISPGLSIGTLTFNAATTMMNNAALEIEIQGVGIADVDKVTVNGSLNLAGDILIHLLNYEPLASDTFLVANATSLGGSFATVANGATRPTADGMGKFTVNYGVGSPFNPNQVVLSNYVAIEPEFATVLTVVRGILTGGTVGDLEASDNVDVSIQRNPVQTTGLIEVEVKSTTSIQAPTSFAFTLEASAFYRSPVIQSIEFWDYDAGEFVQFDSRQASRFNDSVASAIGTGDLSRFVDNSTGEVRTRILYTSPVRRQAFSAAIDQVFWSID